MKARTLANIGWWLLILPLMAAPIYYVYLRWRLQREILIYGGFFDGNAYTDFIAFTLSFLAPIAMVGVIGLAVFWRCGLATKASISSAAAVTLLFTMAPLIYGLWLWHQWNVHATLLYWAWWLRPITVLWSSAYAICL